MPVYLLKKFTFVVFVIISVICLQLVSSHESFRTRSIYWHYEENVDNVDKFTHVLTMYIVMIEIADTLYFNSIYSMFSIFL